MPDRTGPSAIRVDSMRTAFMVMRRSNQSLTRCLRVITQDPPVGWLLDPPRRGEEARSVLLLTRADVEELLDVEALIDALADAMANLSAGKASMPNRVAAHVDDGMSLLVAMPAFDPATDALTAKLVLLFP